jgi:hypothetical protein
MSLREHIAEHFWSYTIVGGLLGWAAVKGEQYAKDDQYAADAYDMNLHVWLCGRCHHVFDEKEEADECCLDEVDETAESVQAEMFIESDGLAVAVEGLDGTYLTDGEIKMGYTSASEAGFEPKELKTVMWVWDDIEGYGAYLATEQITFLSESFRSEHIPTDLPLSFSTPAVNTQTCIAGNPYFTFGLCDRSPDGWGNSRGSYGDVGMGQPTCSYCKKVWATMDEDEQRTYISQFEDWGGYYDAESFSADEDCKSCGESFEGGYNERCEDCDECEDCCKDNGETCSNLACGIEECEGDVYWHEGDKPYCYNCGLVFKKAKYSAEYFNADSICPCECGGIIAEHDDRGYGVWECPQCGEDSDVDLGEICSVCWDKELLGESYYENSNSQECRECYGTGGLYDSHMGIDDRCRICRGTGYEKQDFASAVLAPEETTTPMRQALMTNYLMRKSMMEEELRYLQQEVLNGRMSRKQMAYRLMELEQVASRRRP